MVKKLLILFLLLILTLPIFFARAQSAQVWIPTNKYLRVFDSNFGLMAPGLATSTTGCLGVDAQGWISANGSACGTGNASFAYPFTTDSHTGTSTLLLFNGGLISHGSSTFSSLLNVTGVINASSTGHFTGNVTFGAYATTTLGIDLNGKLRNTSSATSTFTGGIFANDFRTNLPNCDSVDTDSSGAIICGIDNTGTDSADDLSDNSISDLSDVSAMTEVTGDLLYYNGGWDRLAVGTRGNILSVTAGGVPSWIATSTMPLGGDVTGTLSSSVVGDDSHAHTGATLSGLDISDDTNLTGGLGLTLTGDDMACDTASGSVFGCLASADWTTFNNKADLGSAMTGTFDGNNFAGGAIGAGDLLYGASAGSITELGIGTRGNILSVTTGGVPGWIATSTMVSGFANDLKDCTDCINATEIEDIYLFNNADDTTSGRLTAASYAGSGTATSSLVGGLSVGTSGLLVTNGGVHSQDTSTSTFTGGISLNHLKTTKALTVSGAATSTFDGGIASGSLVSNYIIGRNSSNGLTLVGGAASGDDITLQSTENATKGTLFLDDAINIWTSFPDDAGTKNLLTFDATFEDGATGGTLVNGLNFAPTYTNTGATAATQMSAVKGAGTYNYAVNPAFTNLFQLFVAQPSVRATGAGVVLNNWTILSQQDMRASASITAGSTSGYIGFQENSLVGHLGTSGSIGFTGFTGFQFAPRMDTAAGGASTITTLRGLWVKDVSKAGAGTNTVTTQIGLDIESLTGGVSNLAIRSQGNATSTHAGAFSVGTTTANYLGGLTVDGKIITGGDTPSIGGCATGATLRGNDTAGIITIGTDTTSCNIKFSKVLAKTPSCIVNDQTDGGTTRVSAASTTGFQITGTTINTNVINWHCLGVE